MSKELYLYKPIHAFWAEELVAKLDEYSDEDIVLRINSPGGSIFTGWSIVAKMKEKTNGTITGKVDGMAASMAAVLLPYFDKVIATDTSAIMIHKGTGPTDTPEDKAFLDRVNKDIQGKLEKRINGEKFKEMKGFTIAELFAKEEQVDVWLTAKEAKAIGLIDQIVSLNPKELESIAAKADAGYSSTARYNIAAETKSTTINMTREKLLAEHPAIYAEILAEGVAQEKSRVEVWAHYAEVDPKAVNEGIKGGKKITELQIIEFTEKKLNAKALEKIKGENADSVSTAADKTTGDASKDAEVKAKAEFDKKLDEEIKKLTKH